MVVGLLRLKVFGAEGGPGRDDEDVHMPGPKRKERQEAGEVVIGPVLSNKLRSCSRALREGSQCS